MYRIAIGLDIGHGECSASWVNLLTNDELPDINAEIKPIFLEKDQLTTPLCYQTAIHYLMLIMNAHTLHIRSRKTQLHLSAP